MQKDAGEYNIKRQNIPEKESVYNQRYRYKAEANIKGSTVQ